ncbi:MAG: FecR family protein, partial [Gemmatimonadota bacterium]
VATRRGERLELRLPDGSLVHLAPQSTLRVPVAYGAGERRVSLEGAAVFTVTHDTTRPFAVHTARAVARDVGTRFLVRAYAGDAATDVVVAEGAVAVGLPARRAAGDAARPSARPRPDAVVVAAGARARVTRQEHVVVTPRVALDEYFAWTDGRLVFRDVPLAEVAAQLSRWYDVDVRLGAESLGRLRLTASATEREAPEDVLRLIAASLDLDLQISHAGQTYTLRAR